VSEVVKSLKEKASLARKRTTKIDEQSTRSITKKQKRHCKNNKNTAYNNVGSY